MRRPAEAVEYLKKAIELIPDYSFAYYNIAKAYKELNDFPNAIFSLMFSLNYEPNDVYAVNVLGRMFLEVGLNDRALRTFQEIIDEYDKEDKYAYLGKAEALFAMGVKSDALQTLESLNTLAKGDDVILGKIDALVEKYR